MCHNYKMCYKNILCHARVPRPPLQSISKNKPVFKNKQLKNKQSKLFRIYKKMWHKMKCSTKSVLQSPQQRICSTIENCSTKYIHKKV